MGFFSGLGDSNSAVTRYSIACNVAKLLRQLTPEIGLEGLLAGRLTLKDDASVFFSNEGKFDQSISMAKIWKGLLNAHGSRDEISFDMLVFAVLVEFETKFPYSGLNSLFESKGGHVLLGKSSRYLAAEGKRDKSAIEEVLKDAGQPHFYVEIRPSEYAATLRKQEMQGRFPGGSVDVFACLNY